MQPDSVFRHLRHAIRSLRKTPVFTAAVVLTLALGIGANSAVFSAIDAVLLRPLPFPDAGRLVTIAQSDPKLPQATVVAPVRLEDWNRLNRTFTAISGYYSQDDSELSGELPEKLKRVFVAPRFLEVWGVSPALGRDFTSEEEHFNGPPAVLISDRLWRRRFAADPQVLGRKLRIGQSLMPIIGVMPASFLFPDRNVDLWATSPADAPYAQSRELTWFNVVGRMKPGVTLAQARADLSTIQANLGRQFPKTDAKLGVTMVPLKEATVAGVRHSLWIVFGSVTLLLLIACGNIAALLLSRAAGRQQEIAVRFSLGASQASVAAQLITELLLLAVAGASLGLVLAGASARIFRFLAAGLPRLDEIGLDWRLVLYSLLCAVAVTVVCGLIPSVRIARRDLALSLTQGGRSQVSRRSPVQFLLVGGQIALAVILLSGAGLLVRSFQALGRVSPGFDPEHILTFHISTSWAETNNRQASRQRLENLLDGLRATPGVISAAATISLPGVPEEYMVELGTVEGRAGTEPKMMAHESVVTPGYFATLRIPLLAGEMCRTDPGVPAAMINRSFANTYLSGSAAIGRHLVDTGNAYIAPGVIRGIVGDARETGIDREPGPVVYWCSEASQPGTWFVVRTHADPKSMIETIRRKVHDIEPRRSVYDLTPLTEHISDSYAQNRLRTILLAFFALTAISLASIGLYGTLSYTVSLRRREVGLRMALGAVRSQIVRQFVAQGLRICIAGAAVGLGLALALARFMAGLLYGVSPWDGITLAGVVATVLAVCTAASLIPALRAARLEPVEILRQE